MLKGMVRIGISEIPKKAAGVFLENSSAHWMWIGIALLLGGHLT